MSLFDYPKANIYAIDDAGKNEKRSIFNGHDEPFNGFSLNELIDYIQYNVTILIENSAFAYRLHERETFISAMKEKNVTVYATANRATPYYRKHLNLDEKNDNNDVKAIYAAHVNGDGSINKSRAVRLFAERQSEFYADDSLPYERSELKLELIFARRASDSYVGQKTALIEILKKYQFTSDILFSIKGKKLAKSDISGLAPQIFVVAKYLFQKGVFSKDLFERELGLHSHGHGNIIRAAVFNGVNGKLRTRMRSKLKGDEAYQLLEGDVGASPVPMKKTDNQEMQDDWGTILARYRNKEPMVLKDKQKAYLREGYENLDFRRSVRNEIIRDIRHFYGFLKSVFKQEPELFYESADPSVITGQAP